ncbi:MAG: formylglycine-generating enzyme family protein [Saprospiraceae bacterium]|nr:formylglycine-generating enzyme family protein [Saprospiraceae bacterium]
MKFLFFLLFVFALPGDAAPSCQLDGKIHEDSLIGGVPSNCFDDSLRLSMVKVKGGKFRMGSESGDRHEMPVHEVQLSTFYLSKYEVTIGQYLAFCESTNSHWPVWLEKGKDYHVETGTDSFYKDKGMSRSNKDYPVIGVNWEDAAAYCKWLSEKTGKRYRLPTEAEWEYAARGGKSSRGYTYAGSNDLKRVGWYYENSEGKVHPVGSLQANELGLYDMSGNVNEWCADWYDDAYYQYSPVKNPQGPIRDPFRVYRGGGWNSAPIRCRVTDRNHTFYKVHFEYLGFRVAQDK